MIQFILQNCIFRGSYIIVMQKLQMDGHLTFWIDMMDALQQLLVEHEVKWEEKHAKSSPESTIGIAMAYGIQGSIRKIIGHPFKGMTCG